MHSAKRLKITDLNPHLTCVLCGGYFIEATTIIECLHSFCKTCIIRYLETSKFCPICDVQVHKTKPMMNIRADKTLQDIVYKLVPGLFQNEMKRRRECYAKHATGSLSNISPEDRGEVPDHRLIYTPDESISLSLEYGYGKNQIPGESATTLNRDEENNVQRRFLSCPAGISVLHLKKFIKLKYGLSPPFEVDMMYHEDSLEDDYTLMDLAYIYTWRRNEPMRLFYRIFQRPKKRPKVDIAAPTPQITETKEPPVPETAPKPVSPAAPQVPDPAPAPTPSQTKRDTLPVAPVAPTPNTGVVLPTIIIKEPTRAVAKETVKAVEKEPAKTVTKKVTVTEVKPSENKPACPPVEKTSKIVSPAPTPPATTPSLTPEPSDGGTDPPSVNSTASSSDVCTTVTTTAASTPATSPAPSPPSETVAAPPTPPTTPVVSLPVVPVPPTQASIPPVTTVANPPESTRTPVQEKKKPVTASVEPLPPQNKPQVEPAPPQLSRKETNKLHSLGKERKHASHDNHHYPPEKKKRVSDGRYSLEEKRKKEKRLNAISELLISLPRNNVSTNNHHHHHHRPTEDRDKLGGSPPLVSSPKLAEPPVANANPTSAPIPTQPPIAPVTVVLDRKYKKEPVIDPPRDDIGALDLSVSHRQDRPSSHSRPRHVANPAVLDKHRLVTCLSAPKYPSFKIVNPNPLPSSSSSSSLSKKSDGSRHRCKTLTVINPDPTKIVIKNLDMRRDNHHHSQHHHHHHRH